MTNHHAAYSLAAARSISKLQHNLQLDKRYNAHHSTESAVLKVMSDILLALDSGNLALLTLLDLSSAFYSVDHATLIQRPRSPMVLVTLLSSKSHLTSVDGHSISKRL